MDDRLAKLTLEQKAALLGGRDFWSTVPVPENGIPSVVLTDGPHGVRMQAGDFDHVDLSGTMPATCFPPAVAVASSWDPDVAARVGAAVGREARALGAHVVLGPGVNIKRSPLCGRNFEYYSEDPLLAGVLAAAHVQAQQEAGVGASVKHFAANNQETDRMRVSVEVDERTLRELYLPAFERVVREASPATVMCAYNRLNGVFCSEHHWLLTEVLREQWGFAGVVVSDWGAVDDRLAALSAGLDLEMPGSGPGTAARVVTAVRSGEIPEAVVDRSVERVLALGGLVREPDEPFDVAAHHALARDLAADCVVLLKNDASALPLRPGERIAVVGAFAETPRYQGGGSSHINATRQVSSLEALRTLAGERGQELVFAPGFSLDWAEDAAARRAEAAAIASSADVAVVFLGLAERDESEGFDRTTLDLPADQIELVRDVAAASRRTVVVLSNGGIVSVEAWHADVDAIVEGFLLGQGGGEAIADVLFGVVNPSGHLAETIPARLEETASYLNFPGELGAVRYGEGTIVGYRFHETVGIPARYPFGHGLSYTTFATSDLSVEVTGPTSARVELTVTNSGERAGKHVVQCYVATDAGPVRRPARELRAFCKLGLEPGSSERVVFELDRRAFAYFDVRVGDFVVALGAYRIQIGENAASIVAEEQIELFGDDRVFGLSLESTLEEWVSHPRVGAQVLERLAKTAEATPGISAELLPVIASMPMKKLLRFFNEAIAAADLEDLMMKSREAPPQ